MALQLKDRVSSGCTATGTNDIVFGDDTPSFHNWSVVDNGSTVYYCLVDKDEFEVGQGVKSTNGITRDTIFTSTNGGAKINLSGNADVFLTYPADKAVAKDENGDVTISGNLTVNGEVISDSVTLESLGIPHHNLIDVNQDGYVNLPTSPSGQSIQIMNNPQVSSSRIDFLNDMGMHSSIDVTPDSMTFESGGKDLLSIKNYDDKVSVNGAFEANSISTRSSFGYPNSWAVTAQPTEFLITHSGATKGKIGTDGKMSATTLGVGDNWTVVQSGTVLYFKYNGTNKMKLDSNGNLVVTGNVTAYGTV
jgi:hypothetical protein